MLTKQMFVTENNSVHIKFKKCLLPFRSECFLFSSDIYWSTRKNVTDKIHVSFVWIWNLSHIKERT